MRRRVSIKLLAVLFLAAGSVMVVNASTAQAEYLLLLNGEAVEKVDLALDKLPSHIKASNGRRVNCSGGGGSIGLSRLGQILGLFLSFHWYNCSWEGAETTCTINDESEEGEGVIQGSGSGEVVMDEGSYYAQFESEEIATIYTEGVFCTVPEEEVISGIGHIIFDDALEDAKEKLGQLAPLDLKLGNSEVEELEGTVHISDKDDPSATIAVHLVKL